MWRVVNRFNGYRRQSVLLAGVGEGEGAIGIRSDGRGKWRHLVTLMELDGVKGIKVEDPLPVVIDYNKYRGYIEYWKDLEVSVRVIYGDGGTDEVRYRFLDFYEMGIGDRVMYNGRSFKLIGRSIWGRLYLQWLYPNDFMRLTVCIENAGYWGGDYRAVSAVGVKKVVVRSNLPLLLERWDLHRGKVSKFEYGVYEWVVYDEEDGYIHPDSGRVWSFLVGKITPDVYWPMVLDKREGYPDEVMGLLAEWEDPLYAVPDIDYVRENDLWWIGGGGPFKPRDIESYKWYANYRYESALRRDWWGYWGGDFIGFGDVKYSATTGTPRNRDGEYWTMLAVQSGLPYLLNMVIEKAHAQAIRPMARALWDKDLSETYLWHFNVHWSSKVKYGYWPYGDRLNMYPKPGSDVPDNWKRNHGWTPQDDQHLAFEALHDAFIYCGDLWARDELEVYARLFPHFYKNPPSEYYPAHEYNQTARGEGWAAVGAYLVYSVTQYKPLKEHWIKRLEFLRDLSRKKGWPELPEYDTFRLWEKPIWGTLAWQAGALGYGYYAWGMYDDFLRVIYDGYVKRAFNTKTGLPAWAYNLEDPSDYKKEGPCSHFVLSCMAKAGELLNQSGMVEAAKLCRERINKIIGNTPIKGDEQFMQWL